MPLIEFPSVAQLPGVPALKRAVGELPQSVVAISLGALQESFWQAFQAGTQWGIYDSKLVNRLGDFDQGAMSIPGIISNSFNLGPVTSTSSMDYAKEFRTSDFPIERGNFASYNKVETPALSMVQIAFSGTETDRTKFLNAIADAVASLDLYSVVTPERIYVGYSIDRYRYSRKSSAGATLLIVELALKEIRQVSSRYTVAPTPKSPWAKTSESGGKVQSPDLTATNESVLSQLVPSIQKNAKAALDWVKTKMAGGQ